MSADLLLLTVQLLILPLMLWVATGGRRKHKADIEEMAASLVKSAAEGKVAVGTVGAAIGMVDVGLQKSFTESMSVAFREERESLSRRLDDAEESLTRTEAALARARQVIDDMRADQELRHREVLDLVRRDHRHEQMLADLSGWLTANLPAMLAALPGLSAPPPYMPLPPLLIASAADGAPPNPHRRWDDPVGGPPVQT